MKKILCSFPLLILLAGCWTFGETDFPRTQMTPAKGESTIALAGFTTVFTEYEAVHGYRTVYVPGCYSHRHHESGYYETVPAVSYVPQHRTSDMFLNRAKDAMEKCGYTIAAKDASRIVEVTFEGPCEASSDGWRKFGWMIGTLFFCDYNTAHWTARLRIRDAQTGKLVFHHDYEQTFEAKAAGLIPLFSATSCDGLSATYMQSWCLAALTDRTIADATAFLAGEK